MLRALTPSCLVFPNPVKQASLLFTHYPLTTSNHYNANAQDYYPKNLCLDLGKVSGPDQRGSGSDPVEHSANADALATNYLLAGQSSANPTLVLEARQAGRTTRSAGHNQNPG